MFKAGFKLCVRSCSIFLCAFLVCAYSGLAWAADSQWDLNDSQRWDFSKGSDGIAGETENGDDLAGVIPEDVKKEQAKGKKGKDKNAAQEQQPVTVLADYVHYDNVSGEIFAEGNVKVIQNSQVLLAARIDGNTKTGDIWTQTLTRFVDTLAQSDFTGDNALYNYNYKTGLINNVKGKSGDDYITAQKVEIEPEKTVGTSVTSTRCRAQSHAKCLHMTATRVDIWPNDKIIAYNADVYILGKKVYSQARYVTSAAGAKNQIPRFGYNSDDGFYIKHKLAFPLGDKTVLGGDLSLSSDEGLRGKGWITQDETNFSATYSYGYFEDADDEWLKKENNIRLDYKDQQLFKTPLRYRFWFERGHWSDRYRTSWHTEFGGYLYHTPIYLGSKSLYLTLGTGYRKVKESYMSIDQDEYRYDIGIHKNLPKWSFGAVYSNVENNVNLFAYNEISVAEALNTSVGWRPDKNNEFYYRREYDIDNQRLYRHRFTYVRNLHCWQLSLSFERERFLHGGHDNKFSWEVHLAI